MLWVRYSFGDYAVLTGDNVWFISVFYLQVWTLKNKEETSLR